ncbi:MAG: type II toxin-antitoxin system HicA family toxin [Acidobacteria bacterium]|nr:type II toxin-antitoxin system HicA family toxin [Acidobacteriota bacterium]
MSTFPALTGKQLINALEKLGFEVTRTKGSHHFLRHADGRVTVVPVHSGEDIGPGLLSKILRDAKISRAILRDHL